MFTQLKRNILVTIVVLISIFFLFSGTLVHAKEVQGVTKDTINYGVIVDMTGPVAGDSVPFSDGMITYFRHISDSGGINGRKVKVIREDDRYTIPGAIAAFKKLVYKDKIFALTPGGTGQVVALLSQIERGKIPAVMFGLPKRVVDPVNRYVFLSGPTYDDGIDVIFDYIMKELKGKSPRLAFVYPDNEYGKGGLSAARERAKFYGFKMVGEEVLNFGALDATSQVLSLKRAKPEYVIIHGAIGTAVVLLKDLKKYGFSVPVFSTYVAAREEVISLAGSAAKNYFGINYFGTWEDDTQGMRKLREISLKYHPEIKRGPPNHIWAWVTAMIMTEGMSRAGKDLTPERMVEGLESMKNYDTKGLTGLINYSPTSHKPGTYCRVYKADVESVKFIPITEWIEAAR